MRNSAFEEFKKTTTHSAINPVKWNKEQSNLHFR